MKANELIRAFLLLLLCTAPFQLPAQQTDADRKLLAEIRTTAEKGDAQAQVALGEAFLRGDLGVAKDAVEAVKWLRNAAEQDIADAQFYLGICYKYGGDGVAKD